MATFGTDIMTEARRQVATRSNSRPHKIGTMLRYTARKQVRNACKTAATSIGSVIPIPVVGTIVNKAIEKAIEKVRLSRLEKKQYKALTLSAGDGVSLEAMRSEAKVGAKGLKLIVEKIESNQVKLKDASNDCLTSLNAFNTAWSGTGPDADQVWKSAHALYQREHYEDKILTLVETARQFLDQVEAYVSESRDKTTAMEAALINDLDDLEDQLTAQMQAPGSASGYGRL